MVLLTVMVVTMVSSMLLKVRAITTEGLQNVMMAMTMTKVAMLTVVASEM